MILTPKNWQTFQHYKDRSPTWIKLHKGLLTDYKFACLPVASKALAPLLWLLASEYDDGKIDADVDELAFRLHATRGELCEALNPLLEAGFFTCDSTLLADRKQDTSPEKRDIDKTETEERREESSLRSDFPSDFREQFWEAYPNKKGKVGALKALEAIRKRGAVPWETLMNSVRAYASTADPQFTKHPKTWLLNGCWDDEPDRREPHGQAKSAIIEAADRHIENRIDFGPKPDLMRPAKGDGTGADIVRLLPQGRGQRSGDLHSLDSGDPCGISGGGGAAHHGPEDGDSPEVELPADCG